jgi:hypothetical protein
MLQNIAQILLWLSVIAWSLWFGGLMYEMVVILPLWSSALPESVIEWNSRPQFVVNPTRYFVPVALTCVLSSLGAFITAWKIGKNWLWHLISAISAIATLGFTLAYFYSKNEVLFRNQHGGLSGEEIMAIANAWIAGNWIRVVIMAIGFFSALSALSAEARRVKNDASSSFDVA